jgi:hypothetical protein
MLIETESLKRRSKTDDTRAINHTNTTTIPSQPPLLPLQTLPQPHQIPPLNPQLLRRDHIRSMCLPPILLRLKTPKHDRHLLAKLLAPDSLILLLRDLHVSRPLASNVAPGLQVVAEGPLLGVDESVLGGCGDVWFGEDGGDESAGVGGGVAGVEDVGCGWSWLEVGVGAVAAGLRYRC